MFFCPVLWFNKTVDGMFYVKQENTNMNEFNLKAIYRIKAIVDAYDKKKIHVTVGNDDFDAYSHTYDLSAVMGLIRSIVDDAIRVDEDYKRKGGYGYEGIKPIRSVRLGFVRIWQNVRRYWHK